MSLIPISAIMLSSLSGNPESDKSPRRKRQAEDVFSSKRSQKKKRTKARPEDEDVDEEKGVNLALGRMNPDLLADYVARKMKRFEKEATPVELEARRIPGKLLADSAIASASHHLAWPCSLWLFDSLMRSSTVHALVDTTEWTEARTLDRLPSFLEKFSEGSDNLHRAPEENGSPHTIVVTATGLRAADLTR